MFNLKYVAGAKPGVKRRLQKEEKNQSQSQATIQPKPKVAKTVKRQFVENWKVGRSWLAFESECMTCTTCIKWKDSVIEKKMCKLQNYNFIEGSNNLRKPQIVCINYIFYFRFSLLCLCFLVFM